MFRWVNSGKPIQTGKVDVGHEELSSTDKKNETSMLFRELMLQKGVGIHHLISAIQPRHTHISSGSNSVAVWGSSLERDRDNDSVHDTSVCMARLHYITVLIPAWTERQGQKRSKQPRKWGVQKAVFGLGVACGACYCCLDQRVSDTLKQILRVVNLVILFMLYLKHHGAISFRTLRLK